MADALRGAGLDPDRLADARIDPATVHALVELHIEQGIVLETHGEQVGVVTAIAAPHDFRLTFRGAATHAGATPMGLRRDALAGAAEAMVALERLRASRRAARRSARSACCARAPGPSTWCPARSSSTSTSATATSRRASRWSTAIVAAAREIAGRRDLELEVTPIVEDVPVACDPKVVEAAEAACRELGLSHRRMTSGAYHDAMIMGRRVPVGMVFVPSARRRQPPSGRVHRARRPRSRRARAGGNARPARGLASRRLRLGAERSALAPRGSSAPSPCRPAATWAVELGHPVERDLGDRGPGGQPGDAQAAAAHGHGRRSLGGEHHRPRAAARQGQRVAHRLGLPAT